jgi:hypothetical protein
MRNTVFWDVTFMAVLRFDVSEEVVDSLIRMTRIAEMGAVCFGC